MILPEDKCLLGPTTCTACPRCLDPFYTASYHIDWVKTSKDIQ